MEEELICYIDCVPVEVLCYLFTFINSRTSMRSAMMTCKKWTEAFTYEEIWKRSYHRFYGMVNSGAAKYIKSWAQLFRKRALIEYYVYRLSRTAKLTTTNESLSSVRLIGGPTRAVLAYMGQPPRPKIIHLSSENNSVKNALTPTLQDITTTKSFPNENGKRILTGHANGTVSINTLNQTTWLHENKMTFADGHNHICNMSRAIENIMENGRFLVSQAFNNTVAIWEKLHSSIDGDAHSYDSTTRTKMKTEIADYELYQAQLVQWERNPINPDTGETRPQPVPRSQLKSKHEIDYNKVAIKRGINRSCLLKSLLFKYPPSCVYLMPGDLLQVVVCMANNKILVWQTLNNFILKGHTSPVTYCVGFYDREQAYLLTFAAASGEMGLWNLNPTINPGQKSKGARSDDKKRLINLVYLDKEFSVSVKHFYWSNILRQLILGGDKIQIWKVTGGDRDDFGDIIDSDNPEDYSPTSLAMVFQITEKERKMLCMRLQEKRSLLIIAYDDGSLGVYFVPTGQCLVRLPPSRSNQYFSIFDIQIDDYTMLAVDDYCLHWRILGKVLS